MLSSANGSGFGEGETWKTSKKSFKGSCQIDIFYQNVRGLRTKTAQFYTFVESTASELLVITETGCNDSISDGELIPPNFNILRCDRTDGRKQGGVMLVSSPQYELRRVPLPNNINISNHKFEMICATIYKKDRFLFACSAVYIPPSTDENEYLLMFDLLEKLCVSYKGKFMVLGDFNLYSCSDSIRGYFEYFISYCEFIQGNKVENCNGRQLDLVLSSVGIRGEVTVIPADEGILPIDAYHPPIHTSVGLTNALPPVRKHSLPSSYYQINNPCWDFNKANIHFLYQAISCVDWSNLYYAEDAEECVDLFYSKFYKVLNDCVPLKKRKPVNSRYSYPEWYTAEIIRNINIKYKLHKIYKCSKSSIDYIEFSLCRAKVKGQIEQAYGNYQNRVQNQLARDPKSFWNLIRSKRANTSKQKLVKDGRVLSNLECAHEFSSYFYSVYNPTAPILDSISASLAARPSSTRVHIENLSLSEIRKALARIPGKPSAGPDGIPPYILKDCRMVLAEPMHFMLNLCLKSATFPDTWKVTRVVPVPKGRGGSDATNFRPVAILNAPAKVFESAVHHSLYSQVRSQLTDAQHGFRPGRSTTGNLMHLMTRIVPPVDAGGQVDVAYFDFKKAFDLVDNDMLLEKLAAVGCTPHTLQFFCSYMLNRRQYVDCGGGSRSEAYYTRSGVSQGSNLGPLEFTIMINDLPDTITNSECLLFADDLKLFREIKDESDCQLLQEDIDKVVSWSNLNKLSFNVSKCSVLSFSRNRAPLHNTYTIDGTPIQRVTEVKDLGVHFNSKLTFGEHITKICQKAYRNLGFIMRQCKDFTNVKSLRALYEALVKSNLENNAVIWAPHEKKYCFMLERLQNKFIRLLYLKMFGVYPFYPLKYPTLFILGMVNYYQLEVRRETAVVMYIVSVLRGVIHNPGVLQMVSLNVPDHYVGRRIRPRLLAIPHARTKLLSRAPFTRALNNLNNIAKTMDIFACSLNELTNACLYLLCYNK